MANGGAHTAYMGENPDKFGSIPGWVITALPLFCFVFCLVLAGQLSRVVVAALSILAISHRVTVG